MPKSLVSVFLACVLLVGCASEDESSDDRTVIQLWKHQTNIEEEKAEQALFARFNASQDTWRLETQAIPQVSYTDAITIAALAGDLPCLMTVDNPKVSSFVWAGYLRPLDDFVRPETLEGLKPAALGTHDGRVYSVGQFDAALAIYSRTSVLEAVGARIPSLDEPWSLDEFNEILTKLQATGDFAYVLDVWAGETSSDWWAYAMSPLLQSFGGDLIDRSTNETAEGVLNGAEAISFGEWFQSLFEAGLINRKPPDDRGFQKGRVAMAYTGNWWWPDYSRVWGDDLLILPPPDLGHGVVLGGGSWQWGISTGCKHPEAAAAFIDFLMTTEEVAAMAEAAGMIPVTAEAAALTTRFAEGADGRIFFEMMQRFAVPRPSSPGFVTIANSFMRACRDIMYGSDVRDALDDAVDDIERRIEENGGYRVPKGASG